MRTPTTTSPRRPVTEPGVYPVAYTEKLARLGQAIDRYEAASHGRRTKD
ncbi:hypothetical protein OHA77_25005 [Streptosporangium sp. NBC_01639]|nr:hypothetical protein OHA77_25005 [Streptosporangium sp. NBC_01639]